MPAEGRAGFAQSMAVNMARASGAGRRRSREARGTCC